MIELNRIITNEKPKTFIDLKSGYWYYNYDIKEETEITESKQEKKYSYILVRVPRKPEYKLCVELIIRKYITQTQEFDLINSANKAILANDLTNQDIVKYKEYLAKIEEIKNNVKKDFQH